ncbi:unnamed protein product [Meloidogyne enterolobii]|uniref:Uncharacterized protein n=2 Tax=Meloidogyne enterolobii TaxID=390850 RepID=A0ACB0ZI36_MELEN
MDQSLWRKIQELGWGKAEIEGLHNYLKMFVALTFVDTANVPAFFNQLAQRFLEIFGNGDSEGPHVAFINYMERNWIGKDFMPPRFPLSMWNSKDITYDQMPRATNSVESWHFTFAGIFYRHSSNPYNLVKAILNEQLRVDAIAVKIVSGEEIRTFSRPEYKRTNDLLLDILKGMVENSQENELVELLDDALKDFKTLQKTTDDDLDEFMQKIDDEATEKAAQKFEEMLNQMADKMQTENQVNSPSSNVRNSKNSNWENTKSVFNDLLLNNGTENDDRKLVEAFANLSFNQGSTNDLMESLIQTAVSKDVMYAPLKEMHSKFGIYLETKKDSLDSELLRNYNEQFRILTLLLQLYAEEESLPSTSTLNEETKSAKEARATLIANLWIEMQNYGLPPPEITSENNSASSTLNECSII